MVGMGMREQYSVQIVQPRTEHLVPEIRTAVYQYYMPVVGYNRRRCAQAVVMSVTGTRHRTLTAYYRHSLRCPGT